MTSEFTVSGSLDNVNNTVADFVFQYLGDAI